MVLEKKLGMVEMQKKSRYYTWLSEKEDDVDYLVCDWMSEFNHLRQRLAFNYGAVMEKYVEDLSHIWTPVRKRTEVMVHMDYLELVMGKVRGLSIIDSNDETTEGLLKIQFEWLGDVRLQKRIIDFQKGLENTYYEFNKQAMLGFVFKSLETFVPHDWEDVFAVSEKLKEIIDDTSVKSTLDNHYYSAAISHFRRLAPLYQSLYEDEQGSFFVLTMDEVQQACKERIKGSEYIQ